MDRPGACQRRLADLERARLFTIAGHKPSRKTASRGSPTSPAVHVVSRASSGWSDHLELDLAAFNDPSRESVARHPFDGRPMREEVLVRLNLRWKIGLQHAFLSPVAVGNLKRYRLGALV